MKSSYGNKPKINLKDTKEEFMARTRVKKACLEERKEIDLKGEILKAAMEKGRIYSDDPRTKVGCIIARPCYMEGSLCKYQIISRGINRIPSSLRKPKIIKAIKKNKYPFIIHAEIDALLTADLAQEGGLIAFCTLRPCCECLKALITVGIHEVVYHEEAHVPKEDIKAIELMGREAEIKWTQLR